MTLKTKEKLEQKHLGEVLENNTRVAAISLTGVIFLVLFSLSIILSYFHISSKIDASYTGMESNLAQNVAIDWVETKRQLDSFLKIEEIAGFWILNGETKSLIDKKFKRSIKNQSSKLEKQNAVWYNGNLILFKKFNLKSTKLRTYYEIKVAFKIGYLPMVVSLVFSILISSLFYFLVLRKLRHISQSISDEIYKIIPALQESNESKLIFSLNNVETDILEFATLKNTILDTTQKLRETEKNLREQEKEKALAKQARQLHHNIQHALNNLKELIRDLGPNMLDDQKSSLRRSYNSIVDTVNNLKIDNDSNLINNDNMKTYVNMSLEYLISWNRVKWQNKDVEIIYEPDSSDVGVFIDIPQSAFTSIVHNLIKNAVEAGEEKDNTTEIKIDLQKKDNFCDLKISDNGCGISSHNIFKIFDEKFSKGKIGGCGIGLSHAREVISKVNGTISVSSVLGEGSCFTIKIPLSDKPSWYVEKIIVRKGQKVIVIDDEIHYYEKLKKRFDLLGVESLYFKDKEHFLSSSEQFVRNLKNYLFVVDYEFNGKKYTGIDIIEEFKIYDQSILMTNMADEVDVIKSCEENNISLVSKKFAVNIEIRKATRNIQDLKIKFLDDSKHVMRNFKLKAESYGLDADFYTCQNELYESCKVDTDKNTIFFIDYELEEMTGDKVVKNLRQQGFKNFHILTGYSASDFKESFNVTSVETKKFPRRVIDSYL